MENASKALYIIGVTLISLLVVALLMYTYRKLGVVQNEQDKTEFQESIVSFNREYEAFNKKIMYGTDVISCINKARSNNEKYEKNGTYAISGASGNEILIQVEVQLQKELEESFEFKYIDRNTGKEKKILSVNHFGSNYEQLFRNTKIESFFKTNEVIQNWGKNTPITTFGNLFDNNNVSTYGNKNLELIDYGTTKMKKNIKNSVLYYLTKNSNNPDIIVRNSNNTTKGAVTKIEDLGPEYWSSITWKTFLSDFKSRKFSCDSIQYNDETGLIDKLVFVEKD